MAQSIIIRLKAEGRLEQVLLKTKYFGQQVGQDEARVKTGTSFRDFLEEATGDREYGNPPIMDRPVLLPGETPWDWFIKRQEEYKTRLQSELSQRDARIVLIEKQLAHYQKASQNQLEMGLIKLFELSQEKLDEATK